jgi:dTDP-4-dehydrorhamnose 3,5-epimerase-like enzyme
MSNKKLPFLIDFQTIGESVLGYISIAEFAESLPFVPQRVFWTYFTPNDVIRGRHAHYHTEMVLIPVSGRIELQTECIDGEKSVFVLENPKVGVYMPPLCWHTMQYSHNAVQLIFASTPYDASDYIRSYEHFQSLQKNAS